MSRNKADGLLEDSFYQMLELEVFRGSESQYL